jgi:predicted nuclease of restriction endonuclease-like RecB superfamily
VRYRSRVEGDVAVALASRGLHAEYEAERFSYVVKLHYTPDFKIHGPAGHFYLEVKGRYTSRDRTKTLEFIRSYPDERLLVALQNPYGKLNKKSSTTYVDWCDKYRVPWCPIPIPPDFLEQWLNGSRLTYPVRRANRQMRLL